MMMRFITITALVLAAVSHAIGGEFGEKIRSLNDDSFDNSRSIEVENYELGLTSGIAVLHAGSLYFCAFYNGRPTRAYFRGEGVFYYYPQDQLEKQQVTRFYDSDSISFHFKHAYFAFPWNSNRFNDLYNKSANKKPSYRAKKYFNKAGEIPHKKFKFNLPFHILKAGMEGHTRYIYADFMQDDYRHTIYSYDPVSSEQVSVYSLAPEFKSPQLVSSVHDNMTAGWWSFDRDFGIAAYNIDVDISTYKKSEIACRINLTVNTDSLKYIDLNFPKDYKIDSLTGDAAGFIKEKDRSELLIELTRFFKKNESVAIDVHYRTNLFRHYMSLGVTQKNLIGWYPYSGFRQLSNYDVTYHIDRGFEFISVGDKIADSIVDGRRFLRYVSPGQIAYVSFNYGLFDSVRIDGADVPITLYYLRSRHNSPIFGRGYIERMAVEILQTFDFYSNHFAPYPFRRLDIGAMAVGYGQGSPGVVHLAEITFDRATPGIDDKFRAHEVAHQWWGHLVNPGSYHDAWLSEGLAEYSAALYIDMVKNNKDAFWRILKDWKKSIVQSGRLFDRKSVGFKAGSVVMGYRLQTELSPGDYQAIVYYKAAYILHMLRYELKVMTGDDESFMRVLGNFARAYAGRLTSTENFIEGARKELGARTDQFFRQWLYDWKVPRIEGSFNAKSGSAGEIIINVQEVDDGFSTPYPVRINLADGTKIEKNYYITNGLNSFKIDGKPGLKILSADFNPEGDILEQ